MPWRIGPIPRARQRRKLLKPAPTAMIARLAPVYATDVEPIRVTSRNNDIF